MADSSDRRTVDESFASVAEHAPAMLWRGDAEGKCVYLNRALREFWGVPKDRIAEFSWASTLLPEDADMVFGPFAEGMSKQEAFACEARYKRADGAVRILRTRAEPRFDDAGAFTGMVGVNVDITEERQAQAELAESEARLRALADNLPYGMVYQILQSADGSRRFTFVSSQCRALNGVPAEAALANPATLYELILPEFREAFAAAEAQAKETLTGFEFETKMRRVDGEVRWFRIASAPRQMPNGDVIWDGMQVDIHDIKAAEEHRQLLMREMSHRIKNNLSTVVSIAAQTGRSAQSIDAFNKAFQARLRALADSHDLLLRDATDTADLRDILEAQLRPYSGDVEGALPLEGASVSLAGRAAVALSLVLHELATNAAKYGAYSKGGAVEVNWSVGSDGLVTLEWRERGGPPVKAPTKAGFGSRLIESLLTAELGGSIDPLYTNRGFEAQLTFRTMTKGDALSSR